MEIHLAREFLLVDNMRKFVYRFAPILLITINIWPLEQPVQAKESIDVQVFVLLNTDAPQSLALAQEIITADGGQVTHTFPYQALIAKTPQVTIQYLTGLPNVAGIFTEQIELAQMDVYGPQARRLAEVWNNLILPPSATVDMNLMAEEHPEDHNDTFIAPDLPSGDELNVLSESPVTPGYFQTSDYMAGSVAVGIILVESDGSIDSSSEDWTAAEKQLVFSEVVAALDWWAKLEPRANLSFVYDDHFSNPLPTKVEPITRPYYHQQYWISDAMAALGYNASSYFTRVRDYNNDLRAIYQTDWAFTIFVVDSSVDSDNRFSDGYFAYAYLGGPFTVLTYGNNGYGPYNMDAVAAHEIGHIFNALDQYYNAYQPCTRRSGYLNIENQNSQYGNCASNATSIMRGQTYPYWVKAIDPYAAGQLGWRDSDNDNILDPLDTDLPITIDALVKGDNSFSVTGTANVIPYPSPTFASVTINNLTGVQYRLNAGPWQAATAGDGKFDSPAEAYNFTTAPLSPGMYTLEVAALDSAGNISQAYATETVTILDPIDGGLNTDLNLPDGKIFVSQSSSAINGVAYHLLDGVVTKVEYRINGGTWQPAKAQDGTFDSNYEPFTVSIETLQPGTYLLEARAIDAGGHTESNWATAQVELTNLHNIFLPLVTRGL